MSADREAAEAFRSNARTLRQWQHADEATDEEVDALARQHRLLTVAEAAAVLRVHVRTVRNWAKAGWLDEVRLGPDQVVVRITAESVNRCLDAGRMIFGT